MDTIAFNDSVVAWGRGALVGVGAWAWSVWGPTVPVGVACTAMVIGDVWSARRLARRLRNKRPTRAQALKFSSARFGRVVRTLMRIYGLLAIAAVVEREVVGEWIHLTKLAAAIVCFWQAVSIVENEASSNPLPWAKAVGRWLVDKSSRYLSEDDLPKF